MSKYSQSLTKNLAVRPHKPSDTLVQVFGLVFIATSFLALLIAMQAVVYSADKEPNLNHKFTEYGK